MQFMTGKVLKDFLVFALLFVTTLVLCYPLVSEGYLTGYDKLHLLWAQQFLKSQTAGIFYPQWVADANLGCGNATFIFYPPLTFFIYSLINIFIKDVLMVISISAFLGMFASGITMYIFCRMHMARFNALLSSILYMAMPYHLIDLYTRMALAEFWAFPWIPLICFFTVKIRERKIFYLIGLSISYSGLILTHLPTAFLFSPFLISYSIFLLFKEHDRKYFLYRVIALCFGLSISSFYLVPAFFEQQYVNIEYLTKYASSVKYNFLFSSYVQNLALNRKISQVAITTSLIAIVLLILRMFHKEKSDASPLSYGSFFSVTIIIIFLMMLSYSKALWENLPFLKYVQFPTRLLSLTSFLASLSISLIFEELFNRPNFIKRWIRIVSVFVISILILLNGWYSFNIVDSFKSFSFKYVKSLEMQNFSIRPDSSFLEMLKNYSHYFIGNLWMLDVIEYRPLWSVEKVDTSNVLLNYEYKKRIHNDYLKFVQKKISEFPHFKFSIEESILYENYGSYIIFPPLNLLHIMIGTEAAIILPHEMLKDNIVFKNGKGEVKIVKWDPENRIIHVYATEPGEILIKTFYYPRWKAYVDRKLLPIKPDPITGLIDIEIPQGEYDINLKFEISTYRFIGYIISLIFSGVILLFLIFRIRKNS